jgi:G3E family GTPase
MKKIITIHYLMKNGRGEQLEESTTSFLYGSTVISPSLQSQLQDAEPGDRKTIELKKGAEGADDDFNFEVTIIAVRDATEDELRAGRYLPPVRIHLLSGFLGAGKTTAIEQACRLMKNQNIAVITNDQGATLVDGQRFLHLGVPSREVTGGCFCCNYNTLEENIQALTRANIPAAAVRAQKLTNTPAATTSRNPATAGNTPIVFAESVGSCTDIIATVLKPILDRHPEWQPTVSIFADATQLNNNTADKSVRYIYDKQLEEAQVLVITRGETLTNKEKASIKTRFPDKIILFHNSYNEADIQRWLDTLAALPPRPELKSLDIDYDIYAEGEARLAWLDQAVTADSEKAAHHLIETIDNKLKKENYPVTRLKWWLTQNTLLINARVQTDPQTLQQLVASAITETNAQHQTNIQTLTLKAFQPGYPKPQHRMA